MFLNQMPVKYNKTDISIASL